MASLNHKEDRFSHLEPKIKSLLDKYCKGDLGKLVFPDLDYTVKRAISALSSESQEVKEGYFALLVFLLKTFWQLFDIGKTIDFIVKETANSNVKKKSEKTHFAAGRLLFLSAIIEAYDIQKECDDWIEKLGQNLQSSYNHNEGL